MATIICFGNQKGGVSKTTTTSLITFCLANYFQKKVLAIDLDSQNQVALFFGRDDESIELSQIQTGELVRNRLQHNIDLLSVGDNLLNLNKPDFALIFKLKDFLQTQYDYDYILIDTPPKFEVDSVFGYSLSDFYIGVTETSKASYQQLDKLDSSIKSINSTVGLNVRKLGVIINLKSNTSSDKMALKFIEDHYGNQVIPPVIKRKSKIRDFFDSGISDHYAAERRAIEPFKQLTFNMINKLQRKGR